MDLRESILKVLREESKPLTSIRRRVDFAEIDKAVKRRMVSNFKKNENFQKSIDSTLDRVMMDAMPEGFEDDESIEKLLGEDSIAPQLIGKYKKKLVVGDIVFVSDHLAEIIQVKESNCGYTAYKVKYLRKSFLPEIPIDWHISKNIVRIYQREKVREEFLRMLGNLDE